MDLSISFFISVDIWKCILKLCYEVDACLLLLCHLDELTFYHYEMFFFISDNIPYSVVYFVWSEYSQFCFLMLDVCMVYFFCPFTFYLSVFLYLMCTPCKYWFMFFIVWQFLIFSRNVLSLTFNLTFNMLWVKPTILLFVYYLSYLFVLFASFPASFWINW